ncbi:MAG TPA: DoxX family protein [Gaiellaceae bacterium]|jgi:putative oxidoreductase|nr:DoxX family protein [Gaiellaceae bacterium]
MSSGLLLLRIAVGSIMAAHGAQKLFGWWGGPGMRGTAGMVSSLAYRAPFLMAFALAVAESGGGLSLATGFLTPLGALAVTVVMLNAIYVIHWPKGFFNGNGGYEFNLLIAASAVALAAIGPGRFSIDHTLGWDDNISGVWWGVGVAGAAILVSFLTLTVGRRRATVAEAPA